MSPSKRAELDWAQAFDHGIVVPEHLDAVVSV